jgi:hypothetical protein
MYCFFNLLLLNDFSAKIELDLLSSRIGELMITQKDKDDFLAKLDFEVEHADLPSDKYFKAKKKWKEGKLPKLRMTWILMSLNKLAIFKRKN